MKKKEIDIKSIFDWSVSENYLSIKKFKNETINKKYLKYFTNKNQFKNFNFVKKFTNKLLPKFHNDLNKYHNINFPDTYWRIITYNWIFLSANLFYDYWNLVDLLDKNKKYRIYDVDEKFLNYRNSSDCNSQADHYHYWIVSEIIKYKNKLKYTEKKYTKKNLLKNIFYNKKFNLLESLIKYLNRFALLFSSPKIFIDNIGIKKKSTIFLYCKLNQIPAIWFPPNYKNTQKNLKNRESYFYKNKKNKNFDNFFNSIFFKIIPNTFLEDFEHINLALNNFWPKKVKTIMTQSLRHFDILRIWAANMKMKKAKIYLLQHGGMYGMNKFFEGEETDSLLADKFFTWGWKNNTKNVIPHFNLPFSVKKIKTCLKSRDKIIFCISSNSKYLTFIPGCFPRNNIQRLNKIFLVKKTLTGLTQKVRKKIVIRYNEKAYLNNHTTIPQKLFGQKFKYDNCSSELIEHLNNTKLVIHDTFSTGWLETIFFNTPTVIIIDKEIEQFRSSFNKHLNRLIKCKIIHYNSSSLISFVNSNYDNIDKWWNSDQVNTCVNLLKKEYIKESNQPLNDLIKIFKKI